MKKLHDHAGDEDCFDGSCGPRPVSVSDMTNAVSHTPTPWKVTTTNEVWMSSVCGSDGDEIAQCFKFKNESEANAAFIVRAVNSHEELLEAAKSLIKYGVVGDEYKEQVRQAIAKAEGK